MSTITIQMPRDTAEAIASFAENMLDDAPDTVAAPISEAIRVIGAAIQKHDAAQAQYAAEQAQRAATEAEAAAIPTAEVRIRMTKMIRFKLGKVLRIGEVLSVTRRAESRWHPGDDMRPRWTVETSYTYTDPATGYSFGIPASHAKEVAS